MSKTAPRICLSANRQPGCSSLRRPAPAKELLAEFWKLEKEAEKMLDGLATS